ncbi:transketolase [Candidatus Poribacteria bacterium]
MEERELDELCINTIRTLAMDGVQKANSGHPGAPMGLAPLAYVLWTKFLRHNPRNPEWHNRDRFVLSGGHASMLIYSLLHLTGYDLPLGELKQFRQWESRTPGHPEYGLTPGVETTTGPLGQGIGNAVGMAIAERWLAERFNRPGYPIVDHYFYVTAGDGDMMEGISSEAASLAGHLRLSKLILFYDDNHISIEGSTDLTFTEDVPHRFEAQGWHVQSVDDGNNDLESISAAILAAQAEKERPSFIALRTHIAYGSPNKQDTAEAHGAPLGEDEILLTKKKLGWEWEEPFHVPEESLERFRESVSRGSDQEAEWDKLFEAYSKEYPDLAKEYSIFMNGELSEGWKDAIPVFPADDAGAATRSSSGKVLNALAPQIPNLVGGSADLAPSTKTNLDDYDSISGDNFSGRNLHFGVREHVMGAVVNGMALHGGLIPYGATFLVFTDYMRPTIRLAAIMEIPSIFVYTHDSIGVGEDGPTHQPVEHVAALRVIPNLVVIRPADANETAVAWRIALESKDRPVALALTRQNLPTLDRTKFSSADGLAKGAYILSDPEDGAPDIILIASGSEVSLVLEASEQLREKGVKVRVVSMPSWELFDEQDQAYRDEVLLSSVTMRLAVEAGSTQGWHRYVGSAGDVIGLDRFGASAPGGTVYKELGLTAERIVERALALVGK